MKTPTASLRAPILVLLAISLLFFGCTAYQESQMRDIPRIQGQSQPYSDNAEGTPQSQAAYENQNNYARQAGENSGWGQGNAQANENRAWQANESTNWGQGNAQANENNAWQANESANLQQESNSGKYSMHNFGCEGSGAVNFTYPPRKIQDIGFIEPLGLMLSSHVTPIDHQYYYPIVWTQELDETKFKDVYVPAAGIITSLESMPAYFSQANGGSIGDYRIVIHHTCTFYTIYIHVNKLSPKLQAAVGGKGRLETPMKMDAGELLGQARSFDFSVHNEEKNLDGFIFPEHYRSEAWKVHTVDPFDYFVPQVRAQLLGKSLRSHAPLGGKIDHDIAGTLSGNWFMEGTNWYEGVKKPEYWETHASFSPNAIDPSHFIVSLGNYSGEAKQFGAKGNAPKPQDVTVSSGLVKYELVGFGYKDGSGNHWNQITYAAGLKAENSNEVYGTVLVQLLPEGKLKLEAFAGKKASQIPGFTSNARVYER